MKKGVIAVIKHNEYVLIGKKNSKSMSYLAGKWCFPGEKLKSGETDLEALIRLGQEEANIEISKSDYLGVHESEAYRINWYICDYKRGVCKANSDLDDVKWVPKRIALHLIHRDAYAKMPEDVKAYFGKDL